MNDFRTQFPDKILFCVITALLAFGCKKSGEPFSGPPNDLKRYPYERLHVSYEYSGDVRGTEDLFVSGYGKYEIRQSKFDIFTPKEVHSSNTGTITRFADIFTMDFSQMRAIHDHPRFLDSLYHLEGNDIPSPQEYMETDLKRNYFKNTGIDIIAGKPTTRWEQIDGNLTLWIWNGLLIRKHANSENGSLDMTIKNIDTLWVVDTTKFIVPAGFTVIEAEKLKHAPDAN